LPNTLVTVDIAFTIPLTAIIALFVVVAIALAAFTLFAAIVGSLQS
jgi:hypothetical protein